MLKLCCEDIRRTAVLGAAGWNGIDFIEVEDSPSLPDSVRQKTLYVHFLKSDGVTALLPTNVQVTGGERITAINVTGASVEAGSPANVLTVTVDKAGDFSPYVLSIVTDSDHPQPPVGFDIILSSITFSFKVACPTDQDCQPEQSCVPAAVPPPAINYLAKDFATFRQLMLDRISTLVPSWSEQHTADFGVAAVELLAYVGDYLSYQQDAIATEAYIGTARRRISVRRHARLVDYYMSDGNNSRVWVQIMVNQDVLLASNSGPAGSLPVQLLTRCVQVPQLIAPGSAAYQTALSQQPQVFELMVETVNLYKAANEILFWTWGDQQCCLPAGATSATLAVNLPSLQPGDVLIFEEKRGPITGATADADPSHRCAIRLVTVQTNDSIGNPLTDPLYDQPITNITWHPNDALPFPVCISALSTGGDGTVTSYGDVSVARGNIVLADNGATQPEEFIGTAPASILTYAAASGSSFCAQPLPQDVPPRFQPSLQNAPLTHAAAYPYAPGTYVDTTDPSAAASAAFTWMADQVLPSLQLYTAPGESGSKWTPERDLLDSGPSDLEFVAEIDENGVAYLRFGDDENAVRPAPGSQFWADYRVGNGAVGNVGQNAIAHIVTTESAVTGVRNPLAAQGGIDPETSAAVCQFAPQAFRIQERAVTPDDYAAMAERHPQVLRAAATARWTGSWYTIFVTVDRVGGQAVDGSFETLISEYLEQYRMAGQDVEVDGPEYVSLDIAFQICVEQDYLASHVEAALMQIFTDGLQPNGSPGLFYPDNFTFGQPVYLGPLIAAAQNVAGVQSVTPLIFQRQGLNDNRALILSGAQTADQTGIDAGLLPMSRLEVARVENDPNYADHGVFTLVMVGGR